MIHTAILDLISNAIIVKWVKSGNMYLISEQNHLCGNFDGNTWKLPTWEFSINYYEGNPDFEIIATSK